MRRKNSRGTGPKMKTSRSGRRRQDPKQGLRLSWPLAGDKRRAVVGQSPAPRKREKGDNDDDNNDMNNTPTRPTTRLVHVKHQDMEAHYGHTHQILDIPLEWNPAILATNDQELLEHFQLAASRSLAILGHDPAELGDALIRTALADGGRNTPSAKAVLLALLAFSSLHRQGVHGQAFELKIAALRALGVVGSAGRPIGMVEAVQHVAAGMLMCSFEIHQSSCTSGEWTVFLRGVKDVIRTAGLDTVRPSPSSSADLAILLDWVYYHDVLAHFSLRHWKRGRGTTPPMPLPGYSCVLSESLDRDKLMDVRVAVSQSATPALSLIQLLAEVCDAVPIDPPSSSSSSSPSTTATGTDTDDDDDHKSYLNILDFRICTLDLSTILPTTSPTPDSSSVLELYQLATLVYLNRAAAAAAAEFQPAAARRSRTQKHVDRAFSLIPHLETCDRQFPVFIFGCEARSDEQRAAILDLVSRTERGDGSRSFNHVRRLLEAVWAGDDLGDGVGTGGGDYNARLTGAISGSTISD
ncbi:fungal-specific transcription factor domain-containing protein [Echria macrotheca]|uniref:Fungal-specific transcription factor domain-containing protein n=1 Tax=Echria macrotheca TaxID=438768 RepID=A0AAJ0BQC5_9PEZI|nr:fungal-specific transcription factor domain-containing protein [Echria macrotheca]